MNKKTGIVLIVIIALCIVGLTAWGISNRGNNSDATAEGSAIDEYPVEPAPTGIITQTEQEEDFPDLGDLTSDYFEIKIHNGNESFVQKTTSSFEGANAKYRYYVVDEMTTSSADMSLDGKSDALENSKHGSLDLENGINIAYVMGENNSPETDYKYEMLCRRLVGESDGLSTYLFMLVQSAEEINPEAYCKLMGDTCVEIIEF